MTLGIGRRTRSAPLAPDGRPPRGPVLVVRPRRVQRAAWACAVAVVAVFTAIASVLRTTDTGVVFRLADQVAMVLLGVLLAAGILLLARPRVRADADGVEVRNTGWPRYVPWELVRAVSFPDGASWARLDLPDHEYVPVLAVQAADGARAVEAIRGLRALHAAARAGGAPAGATAAGTTAAGGTAANGAATGEAAAGGTEARPGRT